MLILLVAMLTGLVAMSNWRRAFLLAVVLGFLQDPLRKIAAEQPVVLVMLVVMAMGIALLVAMARIGPISVRPLAGDNRRAALVLKLFIGYVLIGALFGLVRFDSVMVPLIGVLAYLTPIPAVWLAYYYVRHPGDVRQFLFVYIALSTVVAMSIYLSSIGVQSDLLQQIGGNQLIFDRVAGIVQSNSGLMRTPEVAAWHAATGVCMALVYAVAFRGNLGRFAVPLLMLIGLAGAILTGRRKVLAVFMLFVGIYSLGLYYFGRGSGRGGAVIVTLLVTLLLIGAMVMAPESSALSPHLARSSTVLSDAWERLSNLGFASVSWGLQAGGFFGLGVGAGAQGTQHFSDTSAVLVGGAAEGGLGKIAAELGVPGLLLVVLACWMVARQVRHSISIAARTDRTLLRICLGLLAFVAANVPVFIGASQVYGDPFVLVVLGSLLGFVLAAPRVALFVQARRAIVELQQPLVQAHRPVRPQQPASWGDEAS
ncbi:MAG: hypothetical protein U1F26_17430 [Lysobacterales bacterium]